MIFKIQTSMIYLFDVIIAYVTKNIVAVSIIVVLLAIVSSFSSNVHQDQKEEIKKYLYFNFDFVWLQGIEYYENMKLRLDEMKEKHKLGPAGILKLIQDGQKQQDIK